MTRLMKEAISQLETLPERTQEYYAVRILEDISRMEALRAFVKEGLDDLERGEVVPFDAEDIIRRGEARRAARSSAA